MSSGGTTSPSLSGGGGGSSGKGGQHMTVIRDMRQRATLTSGGKQKKEYQGRRNCFTFPTTGREVAASPSPVSPPSTRYHPNFHATEKAPRGVTISRTTRADTSKKNVPAPGQYDLARFEKKYGGPTKIYFSKIPKQTTLNGHDSAAPSPALLDNSTAFDSFEHYRIGNPSSVTQGGFINKKLERFPAPKSSTPAPRMFHPEDAPTRENHGTSFGKCKLFESRLGGEVRKPKVDYPNRPCFKQGGAANDDFYYTRMAQQGRGGGAFERTEIPEISFAASVRMTKTIAGDKKFDYSSVQNAKLAADLKFLKESRMAISRMNMASQYRVF